MATANHVLLRRITLTASASSVTFDSIPQTGYTDLKLVVSARSNSTSGYAETMTLKFNNSSSTDYFWRGLYAVTATPGSNNTSSTTIIRSGSVPSANLTANTFSNIEIYVPNYLVAASKSVSVDATSEVNSGTDYTYGLFLQAGLRANNEAIYAINLALDAGGTSFVAGSSFSLYGIANAATTPALAPKADGGDIIKTDGTYWYHAFLSSGIFKPQLNLTCDVLQVAGGGGGGAGVGGGGGAGGVSYLTSQALSAGNQIVTVGAGGAGSTYSLAVRADSGNNSAVASLTAAVGGGGGGRNPLNGASGGSGGGGYYSGTGGTATSGQGYAGGNGDTTREGSGGGGGAGGAGANATSTTGGAGGAGTNAYSSWLSTTGLGVSGYIAGGGGGGIYYSTSASGGSGGGGAASNSGSGGAGVAGTVNTGSGGGAANFNGASFYNGGAGGSGLVIIRYPVA